MVVVQQRRCDECGNCASECILTGQDLCQSHAAETLIRGTRVRVVEWQKDRHGVRVRTDVFGEEIDATGVVGRVVDYELVPGFGYSVEILLDDGRLVRASINEQYNGHCDVIEVLAAAEAAGGGE